MRLAPCSLQTRFCTPWWSRPRKCSKAKNELMGIHHGLTLYTHLSLSLSVSLRTHVSTFVSIGLEIVMSISDLFRRCVSRSIALPLDLSSNMPNWICVADCRICLFLEAISHSGTSASLLAASLLDFVCKHAKLGLPACWLPKM